MRLQYQAELGWEVEAEAIGWIPKLVRRFFQPRPVFLSLLPGSRRDGYRHPWQAV